MNDNGYVNSPVTKMLNVNCVCCGRPLVDAISVELGVGPECRKYIDGGLSEDAQDKANKILSKAQKAGNNGEISAVTKYAEELRAIGFVKVAARIDKRFRNAAKNTEIVITLDGDCYRVETPFRRGAMKEFVLAWRKIPGRQYKDNSNYIPVTQKKALFELLRQFFAGKVAKGPKGLFKIPEAVFKPENGELALTVGGK